MTHDQYREAALAMEKGTFGRFAEHIGAAYIAADPTNRDQLIDAFGPLFHRVSFTLNIKQFSRLEIVR